MKTQNIRVYECQYVDVDGQPKGEKSGLYDKNDTPLMLVMARAAADALTTAAAAAANKDAAARKLCKLMRGVVGRLTKAVDALYGQPGDYSKEYAPWGFSKTDYMYTDYSERYGRVTMRGAYALALCYAQGRKGYESLYLSHLDHHVDGYLYAADVCIHNDAAAQDAAAADAAAAQDAAAQDAAAQDAAAADAAAQDADRRRRLRALMDSHKALTACADALTAAALCGADAIRAVGGIAFDGRDIFRRARMSAGLTAAERYVLYADTIVDYARRALYAARPESFDSFRDGAFISEYARAAFDAEYAARAHARMMRDYVRKHMQ